MIGMAVIYLTHPDTWSTLPVGFSFLSGFPTVERRRKLLVPMQVLVDESGDKGQGGMVVLAAVMADADLWANFSDAWRACLKDAPAIDYFKMNEAATCLKGQFIRWTESERDAKLRALVGVINRFRIRVLLVGMDDDALAKVASEYGIGRPLDHPYFHAFNTTTFAVASDLSLNCGLSGRFELIFDNKPPIGFKARAWYPLIRVMAEKAGLGVESILPDDLVFRDDLEFVPLQVADMLAWLYRKEWSGEPNKLAWLLTEFTSLTMSPFNQIYTEDKLRRVSERSLAGETPKEWIDKYRELFG